MALKLADGVGQLIVVRGRLKTRRRRPVIRLLHDQVWIWRARVPFRRLDRRLDHRLN